VTREKAPSTDEADGPFDTMIGDGRIMLSLRDAALLVPVLEYAIVRLKRDGQPLSPAQRVVVARIVTAERRHRELAMLTTTTAAARLLGVSVRRVRRLAETGRLPARRVDGRWLIERAAVMDRVAPADDALSPPARERAPRDPGVPQRHLRQWADPTSKAALERTIPR